jgi:hypothetical protein
MWLSSIHCWLKRASQSTPPGHREPGPSRRPRRTCRPGLEVLEDRTVPSTVTNLADAGPGSLRQAIADANADPTSADTIVFQPGLTGTIVLTTGQLTVTGPVTIIGPGSGKLTISGNSQSRIFLFDNGSSSLNHYDLSGVTLTRGVTTGDQHGGAIEVASETLFLRDVVIANNFAQGIGGGLFVAPDGFLLMDDCTVNGNISSGSGGGLCLAEFSTAIIRNSTISRNDAVGGSTGGGIFYGGGPGLTIENSTISGNTAADSGGGISVFDGPVRIVNSTIAFNTADSDNNGFGTGGGISSLTPRMTLESTIVADNFAASTPGSFQDFIGEFSADHCLVGNTTGNSFNGVNCIVNVDPRLDPRLQFNGGPTRTHALLPGSPAINAGINRSALPTDQRGPGFFRTSGPATDIGAFEVQPLSSPRPLPLPEPPSSQPPLLPVVEIQPLPVVEIQVKRVKRRTRVDVVVDGALRKRFFPFGSFTGRVQVQQADVNGDGLLDVIARATVNGKKRTRTFTT